MKVRWAVLCDYANVTREGKLNLMGVFDKISARSFPAIHQSMCLVIRFDVEPAEFGRSQGVVVQLADADGQKLLEAKAEVLLKGEGGRRHHVDNVLGLQNVVFPHEGRYVFDVLVNNGVQQSVDLTLDRKPVTAGPSH